MFCPNCGYNCGDAKFCSNCGTALNQAEVKQEKPAWRVGMPCPFCNGNQLEGDHCAFCGALLREDIQKPESLEWEDIYDIPYRKYYNNFQILSLERDGIAVGRQKMFSEDMTRFPYSELELAEFTYYGGGAARMLFEANGKRAAFETHERRHSQIYFLIFYLIKYLSESRTEFIVDLPELDGDRLARLGKEVDLREYFDRYCPLREPAAAALSREHRVVLENAVPLIDDAFYHYQKELYEADPNLAVRDYNREWADRQRRIEEKAAKRREKRRR